MNTDPYLLDRMRNVLKAHQMGWEEKRMFGGVCFMVDDKMCFGTYQGGIMVRVAPEDTEQLIQRDGAEQMIHGGRSMKGYLMIQPEGFDAEADLEYWIQQALDFNPRAKSSKKK